MPDPVYIAILVENGVVRDVLTAGVPVHAVIVDYDGGVVDLDGNEVDHPKVRKVPHPDGGPLVGAEMELVVAEVAGGLVLAHHAMMTSEGEG